mgnify:CR=1 FL=1
MSSFKKRIRQNLTNIAKENVFFRNIIRKIMNFYRLLRFKIETFGTRAFSISLINHSSCLIYQHILSYPNKDYKIRIIDI